MTIRYIKDLNKSIDKDNDIYYQCWICEREFKGEKIQSIAIRLYNRYYIEKTYNMAWHKVNYIFLTFDINRHNDYKALMINKCIDYWKKEYNIDITKYINDIVEKEYNINFKDYL